MIKKLTHLAVLFGVVITTIPACYQRGKNESLQTLSIATQEEQYLQDIKIISEMPRVSGEVHHKKVQQMCENRFKELGFQVELHDYGTGINVIGTLLGKHKPMEKVFVSAHYDTVPNCRGADDNASGVAGVFATAKILAEKQHNRTLVVACWDEEEKKTVGSKAYISRENNNNADIKISYVYEMIGYKSDKPNFQLLPKGFEFLYPHQVKAIKNNQNRGNFIALVYDEYAATYISSIQQVAKNNNLPIFQFEVSTKMKTSPVAKDLRRSDHSVFWDTDYPAVMITDTANFRNQNYHCLNGDDNAGSINVDFALKTVNTITSIIEENLQ